MRNIRSASFKKHFNNVSSSSSVAGKGYYFREHNENVLEICLLMLSVDKGTKIPRP